MTIQQTNMRYELIILNTLNKLKLAITLKRYININQYEKILVFFTKQKWKRDWIRLTLLPLHQKIKAMLKLNDPWSFFLSSLCLNWTFSKTASNTVLTNWFYMALCQQNPT
jgi:hypothetical protein